MSDEPKLCAECVALHAKVERLQSLLVAGNEVAESCYETVTCLRVAIEWWLTEIEDETTWGLGRVGDGPWRLSVDMGDSFPEGGGDTISAALLALHAEIKRGTKDDAE